MAITGGTKPTSGGAKTKSELVGSGKPPAAPASPSSSRSGSSTSSGTSTSGSWGSVIRYPRDMNEGISDYVQIEFYKYSPPYKGAQTGETYVQKYNGAFDDGAGLEKANNYNVLVLYMPEDFSTSYSAKWGGREFGPFAGAGLSAAGGIMNAGDQAAMKAAMDNAINQVDSIKGGALPYIGAGMVAEFMNRIPGMGGSVSANDILASTRGEILNPNTEVLYQGPNLRNFTLNWKLHARNEDESNDILKICSTFKKASLPEGKDKATNLIDVPKIVKVRFKQKVSNGTSSENKWITKYKCAAIGDVSINYTPDGSWSTFTSGAPVSVTLQVQFQELKLVYAEDIDNGF